MYAVYKYTEEFLKNKNGNMFGQSQSIYGLQLTTGIQVKKG